MNIQEIMKRINLPQEAQNMVEKYPMEEERYQNQRQLFYKDSKTFFEKWEKTEERFQWILCFYLKLACEVYEEYKEKRISDSVFDDTFYDIAIWCEECYRKYGVYGLEEAPWVANSLKMKLFRLGRLQFEPMVLQTELGNEKLKLKKGSRVLNIHIPAGEKMDYDACLSSIKMAEEFFGDTYEAYICDSWLLSPVLKELLPETSNIVRFQNLFRIVKVYHDYPQAEGRIFKDIREDKENYQEDSSLQRKVKKYVLSGKDIGIGVGMFYR